MKIVYEAVDQEERNIRAAKIAKAGRKYRWMANQALKQGEQVNAPTHAGGNSQREFRTQLYSLARHYYAKADHAKNMVHRIRNAGKDLKTSSDKFWKDQVRSSRLQKGTKPVVRNPKELPSTGSAAAMLMNQKDRPHIDPESRAIRRFKLVQYGNKMKSASSLAAVAGNKKASDKLSLKAHRAFEIAKAHKGVTQSWRKLYNKMHKSDVRDLSRRAKQESERQKRPLFIGSINGIDHVVHPKEGESTKDWHKRVVARQIAYRRLKAQAKKGTK